MGMLLEDKKKKFDNYIMEDDMYSLVFSVSKWNFIVNFNDYQDYLFYKKQIETSINDMFLKDNGVEPIVINYINSKEYFEMFDSIRSKDRKKVQSFENEYYDQVDDVFISSKDRYLIRNNNNKNFDLLCSGHLERHELIYLIRELVVRLEENDKAVFMHGNGIVIDGKGVVLTGNSGSGKTTLMLKLFESNPDKFGFLSNDRVFITQDGHMDYFPIPIILASGTAKNSPLMREFLRREGKLYDSEFDVSMLDSEKNDSKFAFFRNYMPQVYENCELLERHRLDGIIIPKIDFSRDDISIGEVTDIQELHHMCFTPFDYESLRKPWIMKRDLTDVELFDVSVKLLEEKIREGKVFRLKYNPNFSSEVLQDEVKKLTKHM